MCADGILTDAFTGVILASFKIAYGAGQLVNGLLGTRISPKYMIATGLIGAVCPERNRITDLLDSERLFPIDALGAHHPRLR